MEKVWKVVYVNSRSEKKVMKQLLEKGVEAYVPLNRGLKQWSDRKKWVEEPLIKSYVFIHISPEERDRVFTVSGVVNFLRFNGEDAVVRNSEIESLKQLTSLGYSLAAEVLTVNYKKGDLVKIVDGPLKGLEGIVQQEEHNAKIEVVLSSIGQIIKAIVPSEIVALKNVVL